MAKLTGNFFETASGGLSYEIGEADSTALPKIAKLIEQQFAFVPERFLDGIDVLWLDYRRDDLKITIGWDIWSGCFVMAASGPDYLAADPVIREIGEFLETQLDLV